MIRVMYGGDSYGFKICGTSNLFARRTWISSYGSTCLYSKPFINLSSSLGTSIDLLYSYIKVNYE